ncbi:MAG: hypothetical protein C4589_11300 [Peptococcaceae bacterium]|jgi:phage virion morphogenesis protein|nr:MAG: hypothetical protein C4589_11300 [Peptococcaceae bacterium]
MVTRIDVEFEGLDEVRKKLTDMARRGRDLSAPLGRAGEIIYGSVIRNFEEEGRPKWAPHSSLTRRVMDYSFMEKAAGAKRYQKAKRWKTKEVARGHKILQVSGDLRKSIMIDVGKNEVRIGTSEIYARIHQFGGIIKPKRGRFLWIPVRFGRWIPIRQAKIPARPFLMIQKEDEEPIIRVFRDWIMEEVRR